MSHPEIYGKPRNVLDTVTAVLLIAVIAGIMAIVMAAMPASPFIIIPAVILIIIWGVMGTSHSVLYVEIQDDHVRVDTMLSSFTTPLSDITRVRDYWSWIDIRFRGRFGAYQVTWGHISLQEIQDLSSRVSSIIE